MFDSYYHVVEHPEENPLRSIDRRLDVRRASTVDPFPGFAQSATGGRAWAALTAFFVLLVLLVVQFSRYPEWDEAVFLSQSGGFEGVNSEPSALVATRERGTPVVIGLLRLLAPSLANTRLLWMSLALLVLVAATFQIGRVLAFPAILPVVLVSGYWLTYSFASSFFSFFIAGCSMLLASGLYFRVRESARRQWWLGIGLGFALAAAPWFRQVEGVLFAILLLIHSLLVTPNRFWARRWRAVIATVTTFTLVFVVPWVLDSVVRFGSVGGRISSGRNQSFERGVSSQVIEYLATLRGVSQTYGNLAIPPTWATVLLGLFLVGILALAFAGAVHRRRFREPFGGHDVRLGARGFLWAVGASLMGFFMFFIGEVSDRYMVVGSMFLLVAASATAWPMLEDWARLADSSSDRRRISAMALVAALVVVWFGLNAVVANSYESARFMSANAMERNVAVIRALAAGEPCRGVSRYGAPQVEFGTGCDVRSAAGPDDVRRVLSKAEAWDGFTFILWPAKHAEDVRDVLGADSETLLLPAFEGRQDIRLIFGLPETPA